MQRLVVILFNKNLAAACICARIHVCVPLQAVQQHTEALSGWLYPQLTALHHSNGAPLIHLYGRHSEQQSQSQSVRQQGSAAAATASGFGQGAVFNFQVLQPDGQPISFSRVDSEATAAGIYLRTGCVCNPGVSGCCCVHIYNARFANVSPPSLLIRLYPRCAHSCHGVLWRAVLCCVGMLRLNWPAP